MEIKFIKEISNYKENILILTNDQLDLPNSAENIEKIAGINLEQTLKNRDFKGKKEESLFIPTSNEKIKNIVLISAGKIEELTIPNAMGIGKKIYNSLSCKKISSATLYVAPSIIDNSLFSDMLMGTLIASYKFEKYKTKKDEDEEKVTLENLDVIHASPHTKQLDFEKYIHIYDGIKLAKDLVNEPPNILTPAEFANRCKELEAYGIEVQVLDKVEMKALGMGSLLGVAQGSHNEPKLGIMHWNGGEKDVRPLAFVGKGVTFDTGGLSLKPANSMIGMKYDMGGAAVVTGLLKTLALRKAKVNVVGVIGLVENMPGGHAQRPEDVVKSMSGQTIEVLNTDAEGRLVLADALWYTQSMYNPEFMINLATLTGAITVTFADQYAGLFSNNDDISKKLYDAGIKTGEKVWRLPLDKEYDKMMDSKIADMQNIGTKSGAGSITAAQFLQRFVNNFPWAHLDIAGVTNIDKATNISTAGATAFGIRLLNQFIEDHYE